MKTHFDQHLKLREIILERKPSVIVECGAGNGDCTRLLAHLFQAYPFDLHVISDKVVPGLDPKIKWTTGISYKVLPTFPDNSIDLCIIDTDHNFWTLVKELEAVAPKIREGGLIVMHDVETFYHDTGMGMSYWNDEPYPEKQIRDCAQFGGLGDALMEFLVLRKTEFKLFHYTRESHGAAVVEKRSQKISNLITPGPGSVFAKPPVLA